jgi:RimJ/RimL family protein N-acetyltransferase
LYLQGPRVLLTSVDPSAAVDLLPAYNGDESFLRLSGVPFPMLPAAIAAAMEETLAQPGGCIWKISDAAGQVIGVAETALTPPPDNAWIGLLIIHHTCQRQGYGSEVARLLEVRLFSYPGVQAIGLHVLQSNTAAIAFWEKRGYRRLYADRDAQGHSVFAYQLDRPPLDSTP